ncbi:MAG TPA: ion channel [Steroidobacteraceae bacterium]|nr:ion channel [Steroidobacteraceae bacterium]
MNNAESPQRGPQSPADRLASPIRKARLPTAFPVSLQMARNRVARLLHASAWFPHVPLAILVGATGILQIILTSGSLRRLLAAGGDSIVSLAGGLGLPEIRGAPQEAIGGLLILVAIGLLWRSRLAWLIALLLAATTVFLEFFSPLSTASRPLEIFSAVLLLLLLLSRTAFTRASLATATLFALMGVLVTLGYGVVGSYVLGSGFNPKITNFIDAVYFTVMTMATVGYGDITPRTTDARLFTVSLVVLGLAVFATSLPAIVGPLIDKRLMNLLQPRRKKMKRASHVIVVGDGPLAKDAVRALAARGLQTTAILAAKPDTEADQPDDFVVGDGSDTDTLRSVHVAEARAVLALSEDDSYNAFVVLAAKELNPGLRTVAAVSDTRNTGRVARTRPDVLLTLPQLGGELLAMALSGEEIKADALISQLLKLG